jgi:hypothetical protein
LNLEKEHTAMSRNRQAKQERRLKRKQSLYQRDDRRQRRLRLPLETAQGLALFRQVDEFVSTFRHLKDEDDVIERVEAFLHAVGELHLISLPDHKFGISQAVVSVCRLFPEHVSKWRDQFKAVWGGAHYIVPEEGSDEDLEITSDHDIDRRLTHWMVTGDEAAIGEVVEHAKNDEYAKQALRWMADQHDDLADLLDDLQEKPHFDQISTASSRPVDPRRTTVDEAIVQSISDLIPPSVRGSVAMITLAQDKKSWVVATRGKAALKITKKIDGKPVVVRPILPQEAKIVAQIRDEFEDPI